MSTPLVARPVNTQQATGEGQEDDATEGGEEEGDEASDDGFYDLREDDQVLSDDDSFAKRLDNTINDGVEDIKQGKKIVGGGGGGKRSNEETRVVNFTDEDEFEGILSQCAPHIVQAIYRYTNKRLRVYKLNEILNQELAKLSPEQQASVRSQPTDSLKFSKLKEYANDQNKRSRKGEIQADY